MAAFARRHRSAISALSTVALVTVLVLVIVGRWDQFSAALAHAPFGILALAAALHVVTLLARSESWKLCVGAAGGAVSRRRVYRAASVGYAVSIVNGQLGFALRIAELRRSAPRDSPRALALAATEVPILLVEAALAALFSFTLVVPLGLPWWLPLVAFAAMLAVFIGLRSVARHHLRGWWSGLAVMRNASARTQVVGLVTLGITMQIVRNWLLLHASGIDASILDATAVIIAVAVLGALPLGPSTGAGATVLILGAGAGSVGAVAAAGVLLTATAAAAALSYALWAVGDQTWIGRHRLSHALSDRVRTRSAHAAARGMPDDLRALPVAHRRLIEHAYFGGLTHIQLARLLPSAA